MAGGRSFGVVSMGLWGGYVRLFITTNGMVKFVFGLPQFSKASGGVEVMGVAVYRPRLDVGCQESFMG